MKVLFISLGCDKNLVDSEFMLGKLTQHKFTVTDDEQEADVIVVNTCCFIHDAKEESIQSILDMAQYRTNGSCKALIVCGCLAERYRDEILKEIPEVDAVLGTNSTEQICNAIERVLLGDKYEAYEPLTGIEKHEAKRSVSTGGHYAHLKIAEGCSKHCTYCIIPSIRGDFRSVPMEEILSQARDLAEAGVKELILVAQETTLYGIDLYGKKSLHILLNELNKIPGIYWIRLMYCYPEEIYDELIEAIRDNEKVCHYIDMPIQHINSDILKRMGRKTNREMLEEKIAALRAAIPDIAIRTTLICGFPGETPKQHEELMEFINETEFDRLGAFTYSPEENTPAATFDNQVDESVKEDWQADVMELQEEIILDKNETMVGQEILVMIEGKVADENAYVGRSYRDAPDIDGLVFVNTDTELVSGDFAKVHITGAYEYDLIGELI
ncbi:30S ribosomal protein S12 methylthiotransferase RimO [uncultured Eubacterium sp.]|uniref:30S ribosomal protein S12 methylthiotransferase RimO n=1 Tax=uncultured Eubacterium sp. TaxID=165185 RepID=UPI0015AB63CB|nr:30S ribosomal protein S12 methylthiotransferase RimO [uncultured Eubacterium sp.]